MTKIDPLQRLAVESACMRLSARYGIDYDNQNYEAWLALWAENCEWHLPTRPPLIGKAALRAFVESRPKPGPIWRHMATNLSVDVIDEKTATGESYVLIFHAERPADGAPGRLDVPESIVQFRDRYVLENGTWLFAERRATRVLKS
jgi:hypothetical protein